MKQWNSTLSAPKKPMRRSAFKPPSLPLRKERKGTGKPTSAPKRKKQPIKSLTRKLDELFSKYVRQKYSVDGYVRCYCGVRVPWQDSDASHYIVRRHLSTRYSERNVHPSCRRCNRFQGGNLAAYSLFLEERYGQGILQELAKKKEEIIKYFPYQQLIEEYTQKLKDL